MLSWLLVPLAMRVAVRYDVVDRPGGYKQQADPVPYLGGVAIVLSFVLIVLIAAALRPPVTGVQELAVILGLGTVLAAVGLVDDLRGLGPFVRLGLQVAAAVALLVTDVGVQIVDGGGPIDAVITVLWVAGITNAFNLMDNMDGLSAGIATIAACAMSLIAALNGQFLVGALSAALAGCAVGFLRHNRHPARVYMGDAGSLFLGFLLAVLAIKLRFDAPVQITAFVPLVILALPIVDTTLVTVTRITHGRNPLAGGRDHLSHRLVFLGLSVRAAVRLLYGIALALGWVALIISTVDVASAYLILAFVAVSLLTLAVALARVPVYSSSRQRRIMLVEVDRCAEDYDHEHSVAPQSVPSVESRR